MAQRMQPRRVRCGGVVRVRSGVAAEGCGEVCVQVVEVGGQGCRCTTITQPSQEPGVAAVCVVVGVW